MERRSIMIRLPVEFIKVIDEMAEERAISRNYIISVAIKRLIETEKNRKQIMEDF